MLMFMFIGLTVIKLITYRMRMLIYYYLLANTHCRVDNVLPTKYNVIKLSSSVHSIVSIYWILAIGNTTCTLCATIEAGVTGVIDLTPVLAWVHVTLYSLDSPFLNNFVPRALSFLSVYCF